MGYYWEDFGFGSKMYSWCGGKKSCDYMEGFILNHLRFAPVLRGIVGNHAGKQYLIMDLRCC